MAIAKSGNLYYIDAASDPASISQDNIRIVGIVLDVTSGTAVLELGEDNSGRSYPTLFTYRSTTSQHLDFSISPLVFPSGIRIKTVTNANVTLILNTNRDK